MYLSGHGRIFREYWGAIRYQGTFNDPEPTGIFLVYDDIAFVSVPVPVWGSELSCVLCAGLAGDRSIEVYGNLIGSFVFTILAVLYGLYQIGCKKGVSVKVWILGICMGAYIWLVLWWIWPAADFDVKTVDYNMLTRIQEKIWKVAHGGLLGLFLDRGMEKLVLYPQYLLYGAGEGGFDRFYIG